MAVALFLGALYFLLGRYTNRVASQMGPGVQKSLKGVLDGSSSIDLRQMPAARDAVLAALQKHGIDVAHSTAAADPTTPVAESGEAVDRMAKLSELRSANLITKGEFEDHRKRILDGI